MPQRNRTPAAPSLITPDGLLCLGVRANFDVDHISIRDVITVVLNNAVDLSDTVVAEAQRCFERRVTQQVTKRGAIRELFLDGVRQAEVNRYS